MLTIKCMKILRNSLRRLIPTQKWLLYRSYVLSIVFYSFQLWYYNKTPLLYSLKELRKMQRRAIIWILEAFCTSLLFSIKAITRLFLIHLYLQKLSGIFQLRAHSLPLNHIIKLLLELRHQLDNTSYQLSLENPNPRQWLNIKGPMVDMNNRTNKILLVFD